MKKVTYNGIVVKVTNDFITLLFKNGDFKNVPRSEDHVPKLGESYSYSEQQKTFSKGTKYISLVSMFVFAIIGVYLSTALNQKDAYIFAVDINPSVEIHTDEDLTVTKIDYLNEDGKVIVEELTENNQSIHETLADIVTIAKDNNYLSETELGMVALTIVPIDNSKKINTEEIDEVIEQTLIKNRIEAQFSIAEGTKAQIDKSHEMDLSINKYMVYEKLKENKINVDLDELRESSMASLKTKMDGINEELDVKQPSENNEDQNEEAINKDKKKSEFEDNKKSEDKIDKPDKQQKDSKEKTSNDVKEKNDEKKNNSNDKNDKPPFESKDNKQKEQQTESENQDSNQEKKANQVKDNMSNGEHENPSDNASKDKGKQPNNSQDSKNREEQKKSNNNGLSDDPEDSNSDVKGRGEDNRNDD